MKKLLEALQNLRVLAMLTLALIASGLAAQVAEGKDKQMLVFGASMCLFLFLGVFLQIFVEGVQHVASRKQQED